jgi:peptidoglycan/LPS O-acetylase OafA/YrhL
MVRLSFLDGLRGLAAVYVLMFHMALVPAFKPTPPFWLKSFVLFGGTGVTLFFVVSAFSLCLTMGRHLASPSPLLSFYGSRVFRIAPLFFVLLAFSIWWLGWKFGVPPSAQSILLSVSFLFNLVLGEQTGIVWASWTIGVEMLFYAAFPLLYLKLTSIQAKASALFCAMLAAHLLPGLLLHVFGDAAAAAEYEKYSIIRHLPVFLIGMVSFDLFTALRGRENSERLSQPLIGAGALALTMLMTGSGERFPVFDPYYWQAAAYAAVLLGLSLRPLPIFINAVTQF